MDQTGDELGKWNAHLLTRSGYIVWERRLNSGVMLDERTTNKVA